jgi:hypothetical protein
MRVAGLDTGTTSGIGMIEGPTLLHWEAHRCGPPGTPDDEVFNNFRLWWRGMLVAYGITHAAIEEPLRTDLSIAVDGEEDDEEQTAFIARPKGPKIKKPVGTMRTFLRLYGLRAHAIEVCHALNIPCVEVNNRTWRGEIYGKVSVPKTVPSTQRTAWWKKKALDHCREYLHWPITSKDAAEGALIADWMQARLNPRLAGQVDDLFKPRPPAGAGNPNSGMAA